MQKSIQEWVQTFQDKDIPVLRKTGQELLALTKKIDDLTPAQIAAVVYRDPLMTLRVLRFINSLPRGRLAGEVTTVEHGIMMLGITPFFNQFSNLACIEDHLASNSSAFTGLMKVISRAHHAAYQAWDWAVFRNDFKAEEVYIGTLLQSMGEQLFWCFAPEVHEELIESMRREKLHFTETQQKLLGFEFSQFQMAMASAWKLPEMYIDFMDPKYAAFPRVIDIRLADSIARRADRGWYQEGLIQDMKDVAVLLHQNEDEIVARIHHNAVVAARQWEMYGVTPAAALLPLLPGEWSEESAVEQKQTSPASSVKPFICPVPQPEVLQRVMKDINQHLDGSLNLQQLMTLVLKGMHDGIGLSRVVFGLMTPDHSMVRAKYVLGAEAGSPLKKFEFTMKSPHLYTRLMSKMQGLWMNATNQAKLLPLLSPEIKQIIGNGEFYAMSVHVHEKPVGFFYADRRPGDCPLDEQSYEAFKMLCLKSAQGLAHLSGK